MENSLTFAYFSVRHGQKITSSYLFCECRCTDVICVWNYNVSSHFSAFASMLHVFPYESLWNHWCSFIFVLQLVDLKAELLRKQEEFRQQKLQNATNRSFAVPKVSLCFEWRKSNGNCINFVKSCCVYFSFPFLWIVIYFVVVMYQCFIFCLHFIYCSPVFFN